MRRIVDAAERAASEQTTDAALKAMDVAGFPFGGYTQECAYHLMREFGLVGAPVILPTASGTAKGMAALTGEPLEALTGNQALVTLRLETLAGVVREEWRNHGPRMAAPPFQPSDLVPQLCEWVKDGCTETPKPVDTILNGR